MYICSTVYIYYIYVMIHMYIFIDFIQPYIDGYRCWMWPVEALLATAPGCFHHDAQAEPARGFGGGPREQKRMPFGDWF